MAKKILILFLLFFSIHSFAYDFPVQNPNQATFMFSLLEPEYQGRKRNISLNINRELLGPLQTRYPYRLYEHRNRRAPMVILIPGLGSLQKSDGAKFIASQLYKRGLHVLVVSSAFSERFARSISRGVYVGHPHLDAADQLSLLLSIKNNLTNHHSIQISSWNLIGYSYGAATSSYISYYDKLAAQRGENSFDFNKVVLINPPLDIFHGIEQIDQYYRSPISNWVSKGLRLYDFIHDFNEENKSYYDLPQLFQGLGYSDNTYRFFIARTLRNSLPKVIARTQQYLPVGILEGADYNQLINEARSYGFTEYLNVIQRRFFTETNRGSQFWQKYYPGSQFSYDVLKQKNNLYQLSSHFRQSQNIYAIHNRDDFLLKSGDISFLQNNFRNRLTLFPYGGHLGNLWHEDVIRAYTEPFLR